MLAQKDVPAAEPLTVAEFRGGVVSHSRSRLESLAATAGWTAAARARETEREDRLFDDPWAAALAGCDAIAAFAHSVSNERSGVSDIQAITTRFFDDFLLHAVSSYPIQQVVLLAAGLDTRAFRLAWPPGTQLFELDQPEVLAYKHKILSSAGASPSCVRHAIGVDLHEPWAGLLRSAGFNSLERSVWLLEGFLYFFSELDVLRLLDMVSSLAAPGSWLGLDVVNTGMLTSPETRFWVKNLEEVGVPWLFASDEPETILSSRGWNASVTQPGAERADFGRCPYPVTSRSVPGVPRIFLVTAERQNSLTP